MSKEVEVYVTGYAVSQLYEWKVNGSHSHVE